MAARRQIGLWLLGCCALVFTMLVVGGITRLTHSGLSMVEWRPLVGIVPPLNEAQWEAVFARYRLTPEYLQVNRGMTLDAFKGIFWWEYVHRVLGRLIGVAFGLPFLRFVLKGMVDRATGIRLAGIFALGGAQGFMGWYMVKSGLRDDPRVSPERLAAHLGMAFLIHAAMLWTALDLLLPPKAEPLSAPPALRRASAGLSALLVVMVLSGALVAGNHAGLAFNTFPLMAGRIIPAGLFAMTPWWQAALVDVTTVQFDHRALAWVLSFATPALWVAIRRASLPPAVARASHWLLGALALQITLGICTLLWAVPIPLGAAHQAGAMVLFTASLVTTHALHRR